MPGSKNIHWEQWEGQANGYRIYWNSAEKKGYAGTAVFTRQEPLQVQYDMNGLDKSREGRCIALEFPGFWLVTVYSPNSQRELGRLPFRMAREDLLRGIYAYGRWARGAGCERPPGEHGPGRGLGPETGSVAVLKVGDPGWGRARGGSRVTHSLTTRIHPHLCRRVRVLSSRQRALLGPKRAAGSFGHLGVIHSADNCLVSARCAALGTRGLVGNQTGSCP